MRIFAAARPLPFLLALLLLLHFPSASYAVKFQEQRQDLDHQAHAKPGGPYFSVDWSGIGASTLTLDATDSHTHFFDHGPPPVSGSIVKYEWFSTNSGAKLLDTPSPYLSANFFLGVTILKLVVTDSTGDKAEAYTYVSVRQPLPGENESPTVHRIAPSMGPVYGGSVVTVYGEGFYNSPKVVFDGAIIDPEIISDTELRFRAPAVASPRTVQLFVSNGFGSSAQYIDFQYVQSSGNEVRFREDFVKTVTGEVFNIPEITSIKIGPDAAYYAGSLNGYVHVLRIDRTLTVQSACMSDNAGLGRSILGLAFNPNEHWPLKLYVSTSTLSWRSKSTGADWNNGRVEVWARQSKADCLSRADTLITGLPVSPNDHAVNNLLFTSDGILLVAVGGSTNAGVHVNDKTGGLPESPLSGAILKFNMFNASFDGNIIYSNFRDPGNTNIQSGSVSIFASGLRNVYGMTTHSNGNIYAMDNGPNNGFGVAATGCNTVGGQVWFQDKLLHIKQGGFYGHPNWNRGRYDPRQCKYVSGDTLSNEPEYTGPMAIALSSTNGIVEYTANTFNAKLRGQLLLSKLSWNGDGVLKSVKLDESGTSVLGELQELHPDSGLSVEMGAYGEVLMPKIKQAKILVLVPEEEFEDQLNVIAVIPRRGPSLGGNTVLVTGNGFEPGVKIFFGNLECTLYGTVAEDGTSIECQVPRYSSGDRIVSVVAKYESLHSQPSYHGEYEYMRW